jgi:hypothetical protein
MKHEEYELQKTVARYLSYQYPESDFTSDTIASLKLTKTQGVRNKLIQKSGFKTPDMLILEPRKGYCGLFIELKIETPFKKDGTIKASKEDHLKKQYECLQKLSKKGYKAVFSWGFDMTKEIIDEYLKED